MRRERRAAAATKTARERISLGPVVSDRENDVRRERRIKPVRLANVCVGKIDSWLLGGRPSELDGI